MNIVEISHGGAVPEIKVDILFNKTELEWIFHFRICIAFTKYKLIIETVVVENVV